MRKPFPISIEANRIVLGEYKSAPGDRFGLFQFKMLSGNQRLKVQAIASDGLGWDHVSVSLPGSNRCPTWEEMCLIKNLFFEPEECVVQYHPSESEYVNVHNYVLHMWRLQEGEFPQPPIICV